MLNACGTIAEGNVSYSDMVWAGNKPKAAGEDCSRVVQELVVSNLAIAAAATEHATALVICAV